MNIAFLTSYNPDLIKREFDVFLRQKNNQYSCWWNSYGLHEQSVFDSGSALYSFQPNIIFIHYEIESLFGDFSNDLLSHNRNNREERLDEAKAKIELVVKTLAENLPNSKIVLETFIIRSASALGVLDPNIGFGLGEMVFKINSSLFNLKRVFGEQLIINNFADLVSRYGKENCFDLRLYRLAKHPFAQSFLPHLFEHFHSIIDVFAKPRKKCIVVDLDNTLWGGIVGQDGIHNLQLGSVGLGESFVQFQKTLLTFYHRGIFCAICSKNNYTDAMEVIETHPDMVLRKQYFSSIKINWIDKATNLRTIASELNIGTDALVFLDDNPVECELVRQQIPEVEVVNLTGDPDNYINQLLGVDSLQSVCLTEEDISRNLIHVANDERKRLKQNIVNLDDYFKSLKMEAFVSVNNQSRISRIAQLTQKTNQFNLTTRRYSNEQIKALMSNGSTDIYTLRLLDKFGDNGIVLVGIIKKSKDGWFIDTMLMSCRVIGRQAETALLNTIMEDAQQMKVNIITGEFLATNKNAPAADFYERHGFSKMNETEWTITLPAKLKSHFIRINREQ